MLFILHEKKIDGFVTIKHENHEHQIFRITGTLLYSILAYNITLT